MDTAMVIEATSLATVTDLATFPPLQPDAPVNVPRAPLTLYIARVPGSRDVFMTPLKPRDKVVTAEDVQSSLYYVHVSSPDDSRIELQDHIAEKAPSLPPRPSSEQESHLPLNKNAMNKIARKPVLSNITNVASAGRPDSHAPTLGRRPLPAIPPELPPRVQDTSTLNALEGRDAASDPSLDHLHVDSLTLIRRDPSSSEQWNVARIYDPPVLEVSSATFADPNGGRRSKKSGTPLYLDITNPSYSQFVEPGPGNSSQESGLSDPNNRSSENNFGTFQRRLFMPGSRHSRHEYAPLSTGLHSRLSSDMSNSDFAMRKTMRGSLDLDRPAQVGKPHSSTTLDVRSKYYSFTSPWGSLCEFSTGTTGRSLKCKHHLTSATPTHHRSSNAADSLTTEVSELRFNLPIPLRKTAPQKGKVENEKRPSSYLHSFYNDQRRSQPDRDSWDEDMPTYVFDAEGHVDLKLGQEKAGGGFGGKQAKLGKLIVQPEGVKMLDLLVAANVGLWWRAYEQAS